MSFGRSNAAVDPAGKTPEKGMECSLGLLQRRAHSVRELSTKLRQRQFPASVVRQTVEELQRLGLLDDWQFATMFVREKLHPSARPLGRRRILQNLERRGIASDTARQAWEAVEQEDQPQPESERAKRAAEQKMKLLRTSADPRKTRASLWRHLASRGFAPDSAAEALECLDGEDQPD